MSSGITCHLSGRMFITYILYFAQMGLIGCLVFTFWYTAGADGPNQKTEQFDVIYQSLIYSGYAGATTLIFLFRKGLRREWTAGCIIGMSLILSQTAFVDAVVYHAKPNADEKAISVFMGIIAVVSLLFSLSLLYNKTRFIGGETFQEAAANFQGGENAAV